MQLPIELSRLHSVAGQIGWVISQDAPDGEVSTDAYHYGLAASVVP